MNEVRAAKQRDSQLNGQEYVNICDYIRQQIEAAMVRKTNMTIRIDDVEIGEIVMGIERYIRQCDEIIAKKKKSGRK